MDLLEVKSRIAEALVESIFRRARYQVLRYRGETAPLRFGRDDFSPDFRIVPGPEGDEGEFVIGIKYRPSIAQFLSVENQRGERSVFFLARRQWPTCCFILASDRPDPGRSCFQALRITSLRAGEPIQTLDLVELKELRIFRHNIEDHEELLRRIFAQLSGSV